MAVSSCLSPQFYCLALIDSGTGILLLQLCSSLQGVWTLN